MCKERVIRGGGGEWGKTGMDGGNMWEGDLEQE